MEMSGWRNVQPGKCLSREMFGRGNLCQESVQSGNCLFGEMSVGEVSVGDLSLGKCQLGKCPVGEMSVYYLLLV